jgi:hypothetical protein
MLTLAVSVQATTACWITDDPNGAHVSSIDPVSGLPELIVDAANPVTVYVFFDTDVYANGIELFLGYDLSDATTFGTGKDTNDGQYKKLVLSSYEDYISEFFYHHVKVDASSRTTTDPLFGGRLYGVSMACVTSTTIFSNLKVASLTFVNNLAEGESTYLVLSDSGEGSSWTDVLLYGGDILARPSYTLKVTVIPESAQYPDGDITQDYRVDFQDFAVLMRFWLSDIIEHPDEAAQRADLIEDDFIDSQDLWVLLDNWLECTWYCD